MPAATPPTWIVPAPDRVATPFRYAAGDKRIKPVELAVVHWTNSPAPVGGGANEGRVRRWLAGTGSAPRVSSTTLAVLRNGKVLQGASLQDRTWHAAGSTWVRPGGGLVEGINLRSVGLDLENVGPIDMHDGQLVDSYGGRYRGPKPFRDSHGDLFEPYPEIQLLAFLHVAAMLATLIPALADPARWVGHCEIRRGKQDPGPAFPWDRLRAAVSAAPAAGAPA